ncbi:MAG: CDGSH iron-sulfur domain-containing protein [Chitinophagales bacterium]
MSESDPHPKKQRIVVSANGPYKVSGAIPLNVVEIVPDHNRQSWEWKIVKTFPLKNNYSLCRCGKSSTMPYCDTSHEVNGFNGKETARKLPYKELADQFDGPTMQLSDAESYCAYARFCDPGGKIWDLITKTDDPAARALVIREANHCPSGRLTIRDNITHEEIEDAREPLISIIEDPVLGCSGGLWVQGGINIESADGSPYEKRNRVTLCRCGASNNKPFCNGSHASIMFDDGILNEK